MASGTVFLLPFLALFLFASVSDNYQDIFAQQQEQEQISTTANRIGYDYFDTVNPDGTHTWQTHHPYVMGEGGSWVPYTQSNMTVTSAIGDITLNTDGSYSWGNRINDKIVVKFADITDLTSWTYPSGLNNDTPDISFANGTFTSTKEVAGVGKVEYKYIFQNGKWKTQLEATNLSLLNTKAFGFEQVIDINSDTVRFGGIQRNIDNFDGQRFDKTFLENNKASVLDLLNGVRFDFDLGFDNLHSIVVEDTGVGTSRLTFDYRTGLALMPATTLVIDPTYSDATPTLDGILQDDGNNDTCDADSLTRLSQTYLSVGTAGTGNSVDCWRSFVEWDISSIPDSITVTNATVVLEQVLGSTSTPSPVCTITALDNQPSVASDSTLWTDIASDTYAVVAGGACSNQSLVRSTDLGSSAWADIESQVLSDWFGVGILDTDESMSASNGFSDFADSSHSTADPPTLIIEYTILYEAPDAVDDLSATNIAATSLDLIWSEPDLNTFDARWLLDEITYDGVNVAFHYDIIDSFIGNNGTKMFTLAETDHQVKGWDLSPAWDITSRSFSNALSISAMGETYLAASSNGTKLYVGSPTTDYVRQYNLTTAWSPNTGSLETTYSIFSQSTDSESILFTPDGTKMLIGDDDEIYEYTLASPWSLSSPTHTGTATGIGHLVTGMAWNDDGSKMITSSTDGGSKLYQWSLSPAYNVTSMVYDSITANVTEANPIRGFQIKDDGTKLYAQEQIQNLYQYSLGNGTFNEFINYRVNYTTPFGQPTTFLANTTNTYYNVTGLDLASPYSFSVSPLTTAGYNSSGARYDVYTAFTLYSSLIPSNFTVDDCDHTCTTQLDLNWVAPSMDNLSGYRIFIESPVGGGWGFETLNTTNTNAYYNDTSLTPGTFYNYKVAAMNASGITSNSSAYAYSPHKLPDAVDDLVVSTNQALQFLLSWSQPTLYGTLSGYMINYTTPAGDPTTIYTTDTGTPATSAIATVTDPTDEYSWRVSAVTNHGVNVTGANIGNATLTDNIAIGNINFTLGTNPDAVPIWFQLYNIDNSTDVVQLRHEAGLTIDCTVSRTISGGSDNYTGLSQTAATGYVYHNFTVTNAGYDILNWDCQDQTDPTKTGQYTLTQDQTGSGSSGGVGGAGNVPMFQMMSNFTGGLYGTAGEFAGIDLITLIIVIVSMLGFNRKHPALGVGIMATFLGAFWYWELIPWTSGVLGAIAMVVVLAIGQGLKKD